MSHSPSIDDLARCGHLFYVTTAGHKDCLRMRQVQRLKEVEPFFADRRVGDIVGDLKKDGISLRVVDWLVTNYSRKTNLGSWRTSHRGLPQYVELHQVYRNVLKIWRRRLFDPFQRFQRVYYLGGGGGSLVTTTVGQLNFFKIMIEECGILEMLKNPRLIEAVKNDMLRAQIDKAAGTKKKRGKKKTSDLGIVHFIRV